MNTHPQFPVDLEERKRLFRLIVPLMDLLFQRPAQKSQRPWVPPDVIESTECPQLPEAEHRYPEQQTPCRFVFVDKLLGYNLRVAQIARLLETPKDLPLEDVLLTAGLPERDLVTWREHRELAQEVDQEPDGVTAAKQGLWYIYPAGASVYSLAPPELDQRSQGRMESCAEALTRLRRAVVRIERTVNPEAVLERLQISEDKETAILDGTAYSPLKPKSEGRYLHHLRLGMGDWVSSDQIARRENRIQFKVHLAKQYLDKRHPQLGNIIESIGGQGGRVILPLLPTRCIPS